MRKLTKEEAEILASMERGHYVRRLRNNEWVVWCLASDHVVEFDDVDRTLAALALTPLAALEEAVTMLKSIANGGSYSADTYWNAVMRFSDAIDRAKGA